MFGISGIAFLHVLPCGLNILCQVLTEMKTTHFVPLIIISCYALPNPTTCTLLDQSSYQTMAKKRNRNPDLEPLISHTMIFLLYFWTFQNGKHINSRCRRPEVTIQILQTRIVLEQMIHKQLKANRGIIQIYKEWKFIYGFPLENIK